MSFGLTCFCFLGIVAEGACANIVGGILGNEAHEAFKPVRKRFLQELLRGASVPENHDLRRALEESIRDAAMFMTASIAANLPERPAFQRIVEAFRSGAFPNEPLLAAMADHDRRWLKSCRTAVNRRDAFGVVAAIDSSEASRLLELADASNEALDRALIEGMLAWIANNVPDVDDGPPVAAQVRTALTAGWPQDPLRPNDRTHFPAIVRLNFFEKVKTDQVVANIYLATLAAYTAESTQRNAQDLREILKRLDGASFGRDLSEEFVRQSEEAREEILGLQSETNRMLAGLAADAERTDTSLAELFAIAAAYRHDFDRLFGSLEAGFDLTLEGLSCALDALEVLRSGVDRTNAGVDDANRKLDGVATAVEKLQPTEPKREYLAAVDKDPGPPVRCFGREEDVRSVAAWFAGEAAGPACAFGAAGIGKSTVAAQALCEDDVRKGFGERRAVVRCDGLAKAEVVLQAIATAAGLDAQSDVSAVKANCRARPLALILDNAETPWDSDRAGMVRLVQGLAESDGIRLLCCVRRDRAPEGVKWTKRFPVERLSREAAVEAFLDTLAEPDESSEIRDSLLAGGTAARKRLGDFLEEKLDCVPLAVNLVASAARALIAFDEVVAEWDRVGHELAKHAGAGDGKHDSLEQAYEVSIRRLEGTPEALDWLGALSRLPDGLSDAMRAAIGGEATNEAFRLLRELALVQRSVSTCRDRMLAPLREYARRRYGQINSRLRQVQVRYLELASRCHGAEQRDFITAYAAYHEEHSNIYAIISDGLNMRLHAAKNPPHIVDHELDGTLDQAIEGVEKCLRYTVYEGLLACRALDAHGVPVDAEEGTRLEMTRYEAYANFIADSCGRTASEIELEFGYTENAWRERYGDV